MDQNTNPNNGERLVAPPPPYETVRSSSLPTYQAAMVVTRSSQIPGRYPSYSSPGDHKAVHDIRTASSEGGYINRPPPPPGHGYPVRQIQYVIVSPSMEEQGNYNNDINPAPLWACDAFEDKPRRMAFVRKVLGYVALQFAIMSAFSVTCAYSEEVQSFVQEHWYLVLCAVATSLMIMLAVACCDIGRGTGTSVTSVVLLSIYTISMTYTVGFLTSLYSLGVVFIALAAITLILMVLVFLTLFTKLDITGWWLFLVAGGLLVFLFSNLILIFFLTGLMDYEMYTWWRLALCFLGAIMATFYILWDIQAIVGGRKFRLEEDEWLFACLKLFTDIANLFQYLLIITGSSSN